jgi:predicted esterase
VNRRRSSITVALITLLLLGTLGVALVLNPPHTQLTKQQNDFTIVRFDAALHLPMFVSQSLDTPDETVTRAVIVIHGLGRNADGYFDYAAASISDMPGVLLVAPLFATVDDNLEPTQLYWSSSGWSSGNLSASTDRPWRISSFGVIDELTARLHETFSNLESVVIIGHSAGGQFVNRYAAASTDTSLRFVVMNPSSYLYLSPERPSPSGKFKVPANAPAGYDDYKYGLKDLAATSYMNKIGAVALREHYRNAQVDYLLGEEDVRTDDDLDTTPPAMIQGSNRLQRGLNYFQYLGFTFGSSVYDHHSLKVVPGVGHSASKMLRSDEAREAMMR